MAGIDHYENFPVASVWCPPRLRPPILAIYRFARTADDIADEGSASSEERLRQLEQFKTDLLRTAQNQPPFSKNWPMVFEALGRAMRDFELPLNPLMALLSAFEQDVIYTHEQRTYRNRTELLDYCSRSANPIGRLLLHLYGIDDDVALRESDAICTALQLINFWQDLSVDLPRGRRYLPDHASLAEELRFARSLMHQGEGLVHRIPGRAGWELRCVVQGGLGILNKIDHIDPWTQRPKLHAWDWPSLLWRAARMRATQ